MKFLICIFLFFLSQQSVAQISYTDFVQKDNKIEWAAEYDQILNITPKVVKFRISRLLLKELVKAGCMDSYMQSGDELKLSRFCLADTSKPGDSITSAVNPYREYIYNFDYNSNFITNEVNAAAGNSATKFDVLRIKQILTYKQGALQIANILTSPLSLRKIAVSDNSDIKDKLTWHSYFSSLLNTGNHVLTPSEKAACVDYGNAEAIYNFLHSWNDDSLPSRVLTLKNPGFSHHIYQDILDGKITAADEKLNIIPADKFLRFNSGTPVEIPIFDNDGNLKGHRKMYNEFNDDSIYKFIINQHFYLDTIKNILYSEINYVTAVKRIVTSVGLDLGDAEFFRVYFVKPSLYRKPVAKRYL